MQCILEPLLTFRLKIILLMAALLLASSHAAKAAPASPNPFRLAQPDGSEITLRVFGDEWFHWYETMDGRPVTLDAASGFWMYSLPSDTGPNVSSGKRAGVDAPPTTLWQPRPSVAKQAAIQKARVTARPRYVNSSGTGLVPVILANFSDTTPTVTADTLNTMLFSTATGSNSMANFYKEVSYGKFTVSPGASGVQNWVTVAHPTTYYATNTVVSSKTANDGPQADLFVQDAVLAAVAAGYDFSPYAQGGKVPVVCVVHAGYGEESGGGPGTIWSHRGTLSGSLGTSGPVTVQTANGPLVIDAYIIEPETQPKPLPAKGADVVGIGVFCHEYGHALGLPDLYDVNYASLGIGSWSVMAYGSYNQINRSGDCPAHFDPWCKAKLGWINPVDYTLDYQGVQFPAAATTPFAAKLWKDGQAGQQYFLVENRYATGFDTGLPKSGLLIWHIDESKGGDISVFNQDNTQTWYPVSFPGSPADTNNGNYHVELMQADNLWQLNVTNKALQSVGDAGDPFPGSTGNRVFGPNTAPNSQAYNVGFTPGYNSFVTVSNISDPGMIMTADLYTRSPNSGPLVDWVNIGGVVPPLSGAQFSSLDGQNPVVIRAFPGASGAALSQAQLYLNRSADGLWWDFTNQKWGTNVVSSNYNMAASEQRGLTLAFVDNLPGGTNLLNGTYVFTVRVIDSASVPTQLVLAMTAVHAPTLVLSLPDNSVVNTLTNTITAVATEDTGVGIQTVQFALYWDSAASEGGPPVRWYWTGNTWSTTPAWLGTDFPSHPPQATEYFPIGPDARDLLTEKQYTFEARAVDGLGDAVTNVVSVFYDPGAPGTIYWRYPASGNWFNPANWNPQRVPLSSDRVVVNQPGDYTVTIDADASVNSLRFGRVVGVNQQHLALKAGTLTIGGSDTNKLYANSTLDMIGSVRWGVMQLSLGSAWNWTNGVIYGMVNILDGAVMTVNNPGGVLASYGLINNAGTVQLAGGNLQLFGPAVSYTGELINLPGGLVDIQGDFTIDNAGYGGTLFVNQGVVRKSGGTGVSQIKTVFVNSGLCDAETGTISYVGNGSFSGAQLAGPGTNLFSSGLYTLSGTNLSSNAVLAGATFNGGNGFLGGTWTWSGGNFQNGSTLTVASNGLLRLESGAGVANELDGVLTNTGTIQLAGGDLKILGPAVSYTGELVNAPGGLVDFQGDFSIDNANYGQTLFVNQGVVRKSEGAGQSQIKTIYIGQGLSEAVSGTIDFVGNGTLSGARFAGAGTNLFSGGTYTFEGASQSSNAVLAGATFTGGNGFLGGTWTWRGGVFPNGSTLTIATNGVLVIQSGAGVDNELDGVLTNAGTIQFAGGNLKILGPAVSYTGELFNAPGGLVDFQGDFSIDNANYGGTPFVNQGVVRKSGGAGVSHIKTVFNNSGSLDVRTGIISLDGGGGGSGQFVSEAGTALAVSAGYAMDYASITGAGTNLLTGGTFTLNGDINTTHVVLAGADMAGDHGMIRTLVTWTSGSIASGSTLTVATNGTLVIQDGGALVAKLDGILTNAGTIRLAGANLHIIGPAVGYTGELINLPGGVVDFQGDYSIANDGYNGTYFINQGLVRKSVGTGASQIDTIFLNSGVCDAQTGAISPVSGGAVYGAQFIGAGTNLFGAGTYELEGSVFSSNALLAGAVFTGSNGFLAGSWNWSAGAVANGSTLTVATNGILQIQAGGGGNAELDGILTNAGTVRLAGASLHVRGPAVGYTGELINPPGGLVDIQGDYSIDNDGYNGTVFLNQGLVRKSGGTGVSEIQLVFVNSGVTDAETGSISPVGGGVFSGAQFIGAGTNRLNSGTIELHGSVVSSNAVLAGSTLTGTNGFLAGTWNWIGGSLANGSTLTVPANGVLVIGGAAGAVRQLDGILTNLGTIRLAGGDLQILGPAVSYTGELINMPGGLVDIQGDFTIDNAGYGGTVFLNLGVLRKSGGTGVSQIKTIMVDSGLSDAETGTISFVGNGTFSGAQFAGPGTNLFSSGLYTLSGTNLSANAVLAGATFNGGDGFLGGTWTWSGGNFQNHSTLTVASNGVLLIQASGGSANELDGVLTNTGIIRLAGGNLKILGPAVGYTGELVNAPGGLVDFQGDFSIDNANYGSTLFVNQGVVRKSGGSGQSQITTVYVGQGLSEAMSGTIGFVGNGTLSGARFSGTGTNLFSGGTYTFEGASQSSNAVLAGATFTGGNGLLGGTWRWSGGVFPNGSTLTIATNGVLVIQSGAGVDNELDGVLTNTGTIQFAGGNLKILGPAVGYTGELVNAPGGLVDFQGDFTIDNANYGGTLMVNQGVVRKSGGAGQSQIKPSLDNTGLLDVQTGVVALGGGYDLAGGRVNIGLNSLTNFGQVSLPGAAALAGSMGANLNNGYSPSQGSSFAVITYGSPGGAFDSFNLPGGITWQTNYGASAFTLTVVSPAGLILVSSPQSQSATAGQTVTFSASASGSSPVGYQWFFDGTNIAGATGSALVLTNVQPAQAGTYYVVVSNASGTITSSNAVLTVTGGFASPQLIDVKYAGQSLSLSVMSQVGAVYAFEYKNALTDAAWTPVQTAPGTGGLLAFTDPGPLPRTRFYRVRIQ